MKYTDIRSLEFGSFLQMKRRVNLHCWWSPWPSSCAGLRECHVQVCNLLLWSCCIPSYRWSKEVNRMPKYNVFPYNDWIISWNVYCMYVQILFTWRWKADGDDTHIADLLAALGNLIIRGIQHWSEFWLGTFILLFVLPLQKVIKW